MNVSTELLEKAKTAKSAEDLVVMAKAENIELTAEQAAKYFAELHKTGELSDEELDNVSGGWFCSSEPSKPAKYKVGDFVEYYRQYEKGWGYLRAASYHSYITDVKYEGGNWMYKLEAGTLEGAEYINEERILRLSK